MQADEEKVLGIAQLSWLISNSCESRVAHSSQQWCSVLLDIVKQDHGSSLALSACGLLSQLFKRYVAGFSDKISAPGLRHNIFPYTLVFSDSQLEVNAR